MSQEPLVEAKFMDLPLGHYVNGGERRKTLDFTFGIPFYITMYSRYIKRTKLLAILLYVYGVYLYNAKLMLRSYIPYVIGVEPRKTLESIYFFAFPIVYMQPRWR
jgi:hypothetical protein